MDKEGQLKYLYKESEESDLCYTIDIAKERTFVTDLEKGNVNALILFVGEAPGAKEDKEGFPFVGQAGENLDKSLKTIGLGRDKVWIGNVVRFRPTKNNGRSNRKPTVEEIEACLPLLKKEIEIINPKIVVPLGLVALDALTGKKNNMKEKAGSKMKYGDRLLFAMYHPAASIYRKELEGKIKLDFLRLGEILKKKPRKITMADFF